MSNSPNRKYETLINALRNIKSARGYKVLHPWSISVSFPLTYCFFLFSDGNTTLSPIALAELIPPEHNMTSYFRYRGSLTTPDCSESVVWTVFENPIPLSMNQVSTAETLENPTWCGFFFKPQKKEQLLDGSIHAKPSEPHLCLLCSFSWRLSLSFGSKTGSPWWRISGHSSPWMVGLSSAQRVQRFWSAPPSSWWPSPWCSNCPNPTRARRPQMHCDLQRLQNVLHQSSAEPCF